MSKINIAVVGCGYWGPNLIRNFSQLTNVDRVFACDKDKNRLSKVRDHFPNINTTDNFENIINNTEIDAVAIATPVFLHHKLGKQVLESGKHLFIEKPLTSSVAEAKELLRLARENKKTLMVGHTFEYTPAVNKIKEIIDSGELGEIYYVDMSRLNLGLFQPDINVIWDLAPHDLSILMFVLGQRPTSVSAYGASHVIENIEDVAQVRIEFSNKLFALLHVSWLDPCKVRRATIVGSKKMLVYNDITPLEKIRIYDRGVESESSYDSFGEFHLSYRYGDIYIPMLSGIEPLKVECSHFVECILEGKTPNTDGQNGLNVVTILEATQESIKKNGIRVDLNWN
ncbi:MAG: Gfo/Idh/MocA family oxidoreductase [bacterium]|nr:Gfo/Idh/MocA family oxidoreductase [bacterium]